VDVNLNIIFIEFYATYTLAVALGVIGGVCYS